MIIVIILCVLVYFLIAGLVSGLLNKVMSMDHDDVTGIAILFGVVWPLVIPFYLLWLIYRKGWTLMESFLDKKSEIRRRGTEIR